MSESAEKIAAAAREFASALGDDRETLREYLSMLVSHTAEASRSVIRTFVSIFGLGLIFEVLSAGGVKEAEIFSIKVSEFGLLRVAIPVVMAALMVRAMNQVSTVMLCENVLVALVKQSFSGVESATSFYRLLVPQGAFLTLNSTTDFTAEGRWAERFGTAEFAVALLAPVAFMISAYWRLFASPVPVVLTVISMVLTLALLAYAINAILADVG